MLTLSQFQRWFAVASPVIEFEGTDAEAEILNLVISRLSEYTSGYVSEHELLEALGVDFPAAQPAERRIAAVAVK